MDFITHFSLDCWEKPPIEHLTSGFLSNPLFTKKLRLKHKCLVIMNAPWYPVMPEQCTMCSWAVPTEPPYASPLFSSVQFTVRSSIPNKPSYSFPKRRPCLHCFFSSIWPNHGHQPLYTQHTSTQEAHRRLINSVKATWKSTLPSSQFGWNHTGEGGVAFFQLLFDSEQLFVEQADKNRKTTTHEATKWPIWFQHQRKNKPRKRPATRVWTAPPGQTH